jgi:hypothetical protein
MLTNSIILQTIIYGRYVEGEEKLAKEGRKEGLRVLKNARPLSKKQALYRSSRR